MEYIGEETIPEAVTVESFKRSVHMVEGDAEDDAASALILVAAQQVVVTATGRPFSPLEFAFYIPAGDWCRWWFPCLPVVSITSVEVEDPDAGLVTLDASTYRLSRQADEPQLVLRQALPTGAETVRVVAKVGHAPAAATAAPMQHAVILLTKEWFEAGIAVEDPANPPRLSFGFRALIRQQRYRRPCEFKAG
jgi:uncharacterized phiE125 gp8 family phage protein